MTNYAKPALTLAVIALSLLSLAGTATRADGEPASDKVLRLNLRSQVRPFKNADDWQPAIVQREFPASETAIIICDMWDKHWCPTASERCDAIAKRMALVIDAARKNGVQIIHAPSECMNFYKDAPQRKRIQEVKRVQPPKNLDTADPPLPVDASDNGCDCPRPIRPYRAWTRQHSAISVQDPDVISDNGPEIYSFLKGRGIKNVIIMGVHTNMCVLHRSFAIKQMTKWGLRCVLVRDLTDTMYNPKMPPYVSHEEGTNLVVEYIERHWCPSIDSRDLLRTYAR